MNNKQRTNHNQSSSQDQLPCNNEPFLIPGSCGNLEVQISCPDNRGQDKGGQKKVVIVSHPHPLYGGTMQNKVVHYLAKTMNQLGLVAVRYNFRGVGASDGSYAEGIGETEDLIAVTTWVRSKIPNCSIWLAGFSFGGYVSIRATHRVGAEKLITVAPAIKFFENEHFEAPTCPWLLVQGKQDEIVFAEDVMGWCKTLNRPPEIVSIEGAGHFFHGHLNILRDTLIQHLG